MPPTATDTELVQGLRQRNRQSWERLYAEHAPRLHAFALRLARNEHDAADLVQETFVRALPRLDVLDAESVDLQPYLFATLKNLFLKSVERERRTQPVDEVPEPTHPAHIEDDPERSLLLRDQRESMQLANAALAPRQRLVLALRELEDKNYAEIGALVGLNENAVAQLILRARTTLRERFRLQRVDAASLAPACRERLADLSAFLDEQLRGAKLEAIRGHLASCDRCRGVLDEFRTAGERYRSLAPPALAIESLRGDVEAALAAAGWRPRPAGRGDGLGTGSHPAQPGASPGSWSPGGTTTSEPAGAPPRGGLVRRASVRARRASSVIAVVGAVAVALVLSHELSPNETRVAIDDEVTVLEHETVEPALSPAPTAPASEQPAPVGPPAITGGAALAEPRPEAAEKPRPKAKKKAAPKKPRKSQTPKRPSQPRAKAAPSSPASVSALTSPAATPVGPPPPAAAPPDPPTAPKRRSPKNRDPSPPPAKPDRTDPAPPPAEPAPSETPPSEPAPPEPPPADPAAANPPPTEPAPPEPPPSEPKPERPDREKPSKPDPGRKPDPRPNPPAPPDPATPPPPPPADDFVLNPGSPPN